MGAVHPPAALSHGRRCFILIYATAMIGSLTACGSSQSQVTAPPPRFGSGILMGAWVPAPNGGGQLAFFENLDRRLGCTLSIDPHYRAWDRIPLVEERKDVEAGRIPMISWSAAGTTSARAIASGLEDGVIRSVALGVRSLHKPVFIRFGFEMNQKPGAPGSHYIGTPHEFKLAWRRIVGIFHAEHATNAQFVWSATAAGFATGRAQTFYPGGRYVQWVAADGYNRYPDTRWDGFRQIFTPFYTWGVTTHKRLMVSESGSTTDPGEPMRQRWWLISAARWIEQHPRIRAWVYNDAVSPTGFDFRLSTPSVLSALRSTSRRLAGDASARESSLDGCRNGGST